LSDDDGFFVLLVFFILFVFWGVQFSGDALTVVWPVHAFEAGKSTDVTMAIRRACACSIALHAVYRCMRQKYIQLFLFFTHPITHIQTHPQSLDGFVAVSEDNGNEKLTLSLHMGIGCGLLTSVHVGGIFRRWEYILAGPPMMEIAVAEPLARPGQTVVSACAWHLVEGFFEGVSLADLIQVGERSPDEIGGYGNYMLLRAMHGAVPLPPPFAPLPVPEGLTSLLCRWVGLADVPPVANIKELKWFVGTNRYIPNAVLPKLHSNDERLTEIQEVSVVFVKIHGIDLMADDDGNCDLVGLAKQTRVIFLLFVFVRLAQLPPRPSGTVKRSCLRSSGLCTTGKGRSTKFCSTTRSAAAGCVYQHPLTLCDRDCSCCALSACRLCRTPTIPCGLWAQPLISSRTSRCVVFVGFFSAQSVL
jgi:class 3 adenylate cyclase